jgi:hypothetical protein
LASWAVAAPELRATRRTEASVALQTAVPAAPTAAAPARPAPALLSANERRRAPDTVLVALEVASQALADSGRAVGVDTADLASVFVSSHGDLSITDALCSTLAAQPLALSPTRFHHSVHNAASGYWAIGSGSQGPSTALSAHEHSFAVALLEAGSQCVAEQRPVLLVAYDTAACGGLVSVNRSRGLLGVALLLAPVQAAAARFCLQFQVTAGAVPAVALRSAAAGLLADNAMAAALPLFEALAKCEPSALKLPLSAGTGLWLQLRPLETNTSFCSLHPPVTHEHTVPTRCPARNRTRRRTA